MKMHFNKKANIPIILFVIGVFLVCTFALLTFFLSDFKFSNSFVGVDVTQELGMQYEEYQMYLQNNVPKSQLANYFDIRQDSHGEYILLEQKATKYSFVIGSNWKKEVLLFSAQQYLP